MGDVHAPAAPGLAEEEELDLYGDLDAPKGSAVLAAEVAEARLLSRRCMPSGRLPTSLTRAPPAAQLRARARVLAEALSAAEERASAAEKQRDALAVNISRIFRVRTAAERCR